VNVLVTGWFSFEEGHATAGDLLACNLTCQWLADAGIPYEIAAAPPFRGDVDWRLADAERYSHVVFVCGPFGRGPLELSLLDRFRGCQLLGLNLSMLQPLPEWNPFTLLWERDSSETVRPDITFRAPRQRVPVVGLCLVEVYEGAQVAEANAAIGAFLDRHDLAVVPIDTRLDRNETGLRSAAEVDALIAKMDLVVTTRLHGMVLALRQGIPVIAIDPEPGGAKIRRQADVIGWHVVTSIDLLNETFLEESLQYCLTDAAPRLASECGRRAATAVDRIRAAFLQGVEGGERATLAAASRRQITTIATEYAIPRTLGPSPVSRCWGYDRGQPIDRHYIESFLERNAADIRGRVLEVGDDVYTRRFGGRQVTSSDVLHVSGGNPQATIVADLAGEGQIPEASFDCAIVTQTLHLIYDIRAAIATLQRILKPGGVLLATVPGITRISHEEWSGSWYWSLTGDSARRLFRAAFPADSVQVECHGNVLAAAAFLYGYAVEDLGSAPLDRLDPDYEVIVAVRAVKGPSTRV
jgi:hypothetical protein